MMAVKKCAIGRYNKTNPPTCNTKQYQIKLAAQMRKFATFLDDPNVLVGKKKDFLDGDPGVTWFWFGTMGQNGRHFDVWGAVNIAGKDTGFTGGTTSSKSTGGDVPE